VFRDGRFKEARRATVQAGNSSGSKAAGFFLHKLPGVAQALAALRAATQPLIGFALATNATAGDFANLGFTQGIAGADDHDVPIFLGA
jgi:hypothetical protein